MIIKSASDIQSYNINIVVTGKMKIGKTSLLKELAENGQRVLCAAVEQGTLCLAGSKIDYADCPTLKLVNEVLDHAEKNQDKYDWFALDTVTELGQNIWPKIRDTYKKRSIADGNKPGALNQQAWGEFGETIGSVIKRVRALDMNTVTFAHPEEKEQDDGSVLTSPDIYGKSARRIVGWLDEVYYMHMNDKGERLFLTEQTKKTLAGYLLFGY
jgi:hypothetical protein